MASTTIICPKCSNQISIDEALGHQLEESLKKEFAVQREKERQEEREKVRAWQEKKEKEFEEQQRATRQKIEEDIKKKIQEESAADQKFLKEELEENKVRNKKLMDQLTEMTRELRNVRQEKEEAKLEMEKKLSEEQEKIRQKAEQETLEKSHLQLKEKEQVIESLKRSLEEAQRKAAQGSQQLQGEVLELELEEYLKKEFPMDDITPVAKGIRGADVLQSVHDTMGRVCGTIIWESKRTKNWSEEWVSKLKDDMRTSGSDVAILVSEVLPQGIKYFGPKDGIFVTCFDCLLGVSSQIRLALIKENQIKGSVVGKNEKMEVLWNYLSSNQFTQKVEAIVEAFSIMKEDLEREKRVYNQLWAKREKQIERVINNTVGMHGDLQGLMGASLPQIKSLDFDNFELISTSEEIISSDKQTVVQTTISRTVIDES